MWHFGNRATICILAPFAFAFAFALDIYIPAVPKLHDFFHASDLQVQLTLSAFFIVNGVAQIIIGPFADHFGRKKVAIAAAIFYVVGSVICAMATSIEMLIYARMIEAVGACGLLVIAITVIRDLYSGRESGKMFSYINGTIAISPMLAPIIGTLLDLQFGWRACFVFLCLLGLLSLCIIVFSFKETLPVERRTPISLTVFKRYLLIVKNTQFMLYTLSSAAAITCFFSYFSASSHIYITLLHTNEMTFAYLFAFVAATSLVASLVGAQLCQYIGIFSTVLVGGVITLISGVLMVLAYYVFGMTVLTFIVPCILMSFGCTLILGVAPAGALDPFKDMAGTAAAAMGTLQFSIAAIISTIVLHTALNTFLPIGITFAMMGFVVITCYRLGRRGVTA